jgi:hypothetical protein
MIDFPNRNLSNESMRRAARFRGHDSAIEASFFYKGGCVQGNSTKTPLQMSRALQTPSIQTVIKYVSPQPNARESRGSYDLVAGDCWIPARPTFGRDRRYANDGSTDRQLIIWRFITRHLPSRQELAPWARQDEPAAPGQKTSNRR